MRVLIADKFDDSGRTALESLGFEVHIEPTLSAEDLPARMSALNPEALVVRSTRVTQAAIENGTSLSLIVRAGAGYDTIDIPAASRSGVFVSNCPGLNAIAVAELAWGLILNCDRRISDQVIDLREGNWRKKHYSKARGLAGRTLGVVGLGRIGQAVIDRARAFDMNIAVWSRSLREGDAQALGVTRCEKLNNLAKLSDVVSVHVAANQHTQNLIGSSFISALRDGAILVNTSRGSVVDEDAVRVGIREKALRFGTDVYADEPAGGEGDFADVIVKEQDVYGTHHVGASTDQAQEAIAAEIVRILSTYRDSGAAINCVNQSQSSRGAALLTVRHRNEPGVLARVFDILSHASLNVEEMDNIIYEGGQSACARIQLGATPSLREIEAIEQEDRVIGIAIASIDTPDEL